MRRLVRVYIPGVPYLHKTTAKVIENKKAIWNETFELPVLKEELINKLFAFVIFNENIFFVNKFLKSCYLTQLPKYY